MAGAGEARKYLRTPVQARVEIRLDSGVLVEGHSRDLSLRGVWFSTDRSLPIGNLTRVRITLDTNLGQIRIESAGRVVRDDDGGVAIEFVNVGSECEQHLRRVVEDAPEEGAEYEGAYEAFVHH
ncbi:MAG: PilZ domain-containing protein [Candidatus Hydrogenedentes bacterium]|nr:PilZ domain-containing protein [Candidatus Hydrogenedentota bacterium]MBI3117544.1 PilZ domain-containing protein [Candidatus Hydrogenedentota bacterium]